MFTVGELGEPVPGIEDVPVILAVGELGEPMPDSDVDSVAVVVVVMLGNRVVKVMNVGTLLPMGIVVFGATVCNREVEFADGEGD